MRLDSSAQRQCAKVVGTDLGRRTQGGERLRRCDEEASEFSGRLLEPPGRVHDVAMEDDCPAHLADLAGDDLTQMQGRTQVRLHAKASDEPFASAASAARIAKKQRNARASATPSASTQVMTISSPTYW